MEFLHETESVWTRLQRETRPIVLYGMGDGAEKSWCICRSRFRLPAYLRVMNLSEDIALPDFR